MADSGLPTQGPVLAERLTPSVEPPTEFAELGISVGPAGRARGRVPPDQAHHFITTFGILGSAVTGTVGAVLTLHITPVLTGLSLAELMLALVAAALIAFGGRTSGSRPRGH